METILHYPSPFSPPKDANSVRSDCVPVEYEERYLCIVHSNCTGDYLMCWYSTIYGSRWNCQLLMLFPAPQTLIEERPGRFCHVNELNVYLPRQRGEGIWMGLRLTLDCPSAVVLNVHWSWKATTYRLGRRMHVWNITKCVVSALAGPPSLIPRPSSKEERRRVWVWDLGRGGGGADWNNALS